MDESYRPPPDSVPPHASNPEAFVPVEPRDGQESASAGSAAGPVGYSHPNDPSAIEPLLAFVAEKGASDLHIVVGVPPMVRINATLMAVPGTAVLTPEKTSSLVSGMMNDVQRRTFEEEREVDFSMGRPGIGRFRVNAFHERGCASASLRRIPEEPPHIDDLGLPPVLEDLARLKRGLVLVTGPTGSGKSTTLAALINLINEERREHVITIEDPIEFVHRHKKSVVQQREVGRDTWGFSRALKSALREDPDVILIGEMRDLETIAAAISAAETGHLVFATLHTSSAAQTIDRMIDVFPPHQQGQIRMQLSASLQGVIAQRLVPKTDGDLVCAVEVLIANGAVRNLIREGKSHQIESAMQSGVKDGMVILDMHLADLVRRGSVAYEVAVCFANDPRSLDSRLEFPM